MFIDRVYVPISFVLTIKSSRSHQFIQTFSNGSILFRDLLDSRRVKGFFHVASAMVNGGIPVGSMFIVIKNAFFIWK